MSAVTIDSATGCLVIGGAKIFPIGLSEAPAPDGQTRDGRNSTPSSRFRASNGTNTFSSK